MLILLKKKKKKWEKKEEWKRKNMIYVDGNKWFSICESWYRFFRDYFLGESDNCFKDSESWLFLQSIVIYFYVSKIRNLFHTFWISWFLGVALSRKTLFREWKLLSLWKISRSNSQMYVSNNRSAWNAILFFFPNFSYLFVQGSKVRWNILNIWWKKISIGNTAIHLR